MRSYLRTCEPRCKKQRLLKDPIKTVMGIPYLWRSIQLKALHAELLGRRLQANARRMQANAKRWTIRHPGRFVLRALRPKCEELWEIENNRRGEFWQGQSCALDYERRTFNLYGLRLRPGLPLSRHAWRYERGDFKTALLDAIRTNKLHESPSRLTIAQLQQVLLAATA
jgi:hypothetical protein